MRKRRLCWITLSVLAAISVTKSPVYAGWFGPSNYDECVLDKMKGQSPAMLYHAEAACRIEFPDPLLKYYKPTPDSKIDPYTGLPVDGIDPNTGLPKY